VDTVNLTTEAEALAWGATLVDCWQTRPGEEPYRVESIAVPVANVERLTETLAKLQRKATRLGKVAPALNWHDRDYVALRTFVVTDPAGEEPPREVRRKVLFRQCVVVAPEIRVEGWELVAAVDHLTDTERVVRPFPGVELPATLTTKESYCHHCHTRRRRNTTYWLRKEESRWFGEPRYCHIQVGGDCLKDFLGIDPAHAALVAAWYDAQRSCQEPGSRYEGDLEEWLGWVAVAVRLDGRYWSKADAERANYALPYGAPEQHTTVKYARELESAHHETPLAVRVYPEDLALVARVKGYVATLDPAQSVYNQNLQAIFRAGIRLWKHEGLAASAFAGYLREQARLAEVKVRQARPASTFLGNVGERHTVEAEVTSCRDMGEGQYGPTTLLKFVTPGGKVLSWFASGEWHLEPGTTVRLVGTVKKLEEYRGERQTQLTRCRIIEREGVKC
jgi:hypothetical protein